MATQLSLYNTALINIGASVLEALTDARDERYSLDAIWDLGAVDHCLETVQPVFASKTSVLSGVATTGGLTLAYTYTLPADFLTVVGVYSDPELDQEVNRYMIDGTSLLCDYDTIYLRYINNTVTEDDFTSTFSLYVAAYLASKICLKFNPDAAEGVYAAVAATKDEAIASDGIKEPERRPATQGTPLSDAWRGIYNGALQILSVAKIPTGSSDHPARVALDTAVESKAVESVLEDTSWRFGFTSVKIEYDPSIEPEWGYRYAFNKPGDVHRLIGVYYDENLINKLPHYIEDEANFYASVSTLYVSYVSTDWLTQPTSWPAYFSRLVSARIAKDAAGVVNAQRQLYADDEYQTRLKSAMSNDAVQSPPQVIAEGSWVRSRGIPRSYRR